MPPGFKAYPQDYYQSQQFPADVFDLLPEDHKCFLYRDLFRQLDTTEVDAQYSSQGQRAYAPRQIVSILIYAYSHGVFSSRQIERRCPEDLRFPYIAGKNGRGDSYLLYAVPTCSIADPGDSAAGLHRDHPRHRSSRPGRPGDPDLHGRPRRSHHPAADPGSARPGQPALASVCREERQSPGDPRAP